MTFQSKRSRTPHRCKELSKADLEQVRGGQAASKVLDNPAYEVAIEGHNPLDV